MRQHMKRFTALVMMIAMLVTMFPTGAFAKNESANPRVDSGTKITGMTLTTADGSPVENFMEGTTPTVLDGDTGYTLTVNVALDGSSTDEKHLKITLPNGMKFVGLDTDKLTEDNATTVKSAQWTKGEKIYPAETNPYQPDNGVLDITFKSGVLSASISVAVQPDMTFFPVNQKEQGFTINNGISAEMLEGTDSRDKAQANVKITTNRNVSNLGVSIWTGSDINVVAGQKVDLGGDGVFFGYFSSGQEVIAPLVDKASITISVPEDLEFLSSDWGNPVVGKGENGRKTWTFTVENLHRNSKELGLNVEMPSELKEGAVYEIQLENLTVKYYGSDTENINNNLRTLWRLTTIDAKKNYLEATPRDYQVYNYTKNGNGGENFSDYNRLLAGVKITNEGAGEIDDSLIYEVMIENQDILTITAVGIPCDWDETLPTKITVWDSKGNDYTLESEDEIKAAASIPYKGQGFILRASSIEGFPADESIARVKVELPGLPEDYQSSGAFPGYEGQNNHNSYAGVWGRVKPNVSDGAVATSKFKIYEASKSSEKVEWIEAKTTVKDTGTITTSDSLKATTTVGEKSTAIVSAGETLHVSQPIKPNSYHNSNLSETMLLDPVIYIMQPAGMTIQNESFYVGSSKEDGSKVTYKKTEVKGKNLPEGYKLYEYRFDSQQIVLGWWDGDWSDDTLYVDFDYVVSGRAKTAALNLQELILYKSDLGLEFVRNTKDDEYDLNNGDTIGRVSSQPITINRSEGFSVVGEIQMSDEGDKWYEYNQNDEDSIAVFTADQTAKIRITVQNNTAYNASDVVVYVPVPKEDGNLGSAFGLTGENQFDMIATSEGNEIPKNWQVQYGEMTGTFNGSSAGALNAEWSNTPTSDTNIIKLTLKEGQSLKAFTNAQLILNFKATDDGDQTNRTNYFKSWYQYSYGEDGAINTIISDASAPNNFACRLQTGELSGTVYLDANNNGKKDTGEQGVKNVSVSVRTDGGQTSSAKTNEDGVYTFDSLPSDKKLTVTIQNPGDTSNPYRFSTYTASSDGVIGTDVTTNDNHATATATIQSLSDKSVINAGLIQPYTVALSGGEKGTVIPTTVKVFPNETIGQSLGTGSITVTPNQGYSFVGWKVQGSEGDPISTDALKQQAITGDVTYVAQYVTAPAGEITGNGKVTLHTPTQDNPNTITLTANLTSEGSGGVTYQWQKRDKNGTEFTNINGGSNQTLTLNELDMTYDGDMYQCVVTDSSGNSVTLKYVTLDIEKGTQSTPNVSVTQPTEIGGTGSIGVAESKLDITMEYKKQDAENWQEVTDEIANDGLTNLEQGAVYEIRYAETEYLNASEAQKITIGTVQGYTVTVKTEDHAKVTASLTTAKVGDTITVTIAEFDAGYELGDTPVTVKTDGDNSSTVTVTPGENSTYTFDMPASDVTVTASIVPITYNITYDLNDGNTGTARNHEDNPSTYTVETNDITLQAPTRDGYDFTGWTWKVGDEEQTTNPEMDVTIPGEFVGDLTFTAHWTEKDPEQYTVTFNDGEYGTIDDDGKTVTVTAGDKLSEEQIPVVQANDGYRFTGWSYEASDGGSVVVTDLTTIKINGDMIFTAQYEQIQYYTVTVNDGGVGATASGSYEAGANVSVNAGSKDGYSFAGWEANGITLTEDQKTSLTINFNMPENDVTLTATWEQVPAGTIKVTPAPITIYMGGEQGYEGVVDGDGQIVANNSSLPEPGFTVALPEELSNALAENGDDLTDLTFAEATENEAETSKTWKFESYDGQTNTVYKLVPQGNDQEPTRVQFKKSDNTVVVSSDFNLEDSVNQTLTMELYKGNVGSIVVKYDGEIYTVNSDESATLTVRGTTSSAQYADADVDAVAGQPALGTNDATFTINGSNVKASDDVALLFDEIIGEERETQLTAKAESVLGTANGERGYEFKYLDLVDRGNADAWVTASNNVTVYWPLPTEAVATDTVKVLHFTGLHRENSNNDIPSAIESCTVETIQDARVENGYVVFDIGSGGFSPFALVWETAAEQPPAETEYTITASAGNGGMISPAGAVTVDEGKDQTFTITANNGYSIADVVVDGASVGAVDSYTFEDVTANHTINVTFKRDYTPPPYDPGEPDPEPEPDDPEPDEPDTPDDLNTVDHFSYVVGYEDGTVMPQKQITRAEVATIFYRLLKEDVRDENTTDVSDFSDVSSSDWYGTTVATLADMGIVKGYEDGTFRPNAPITRAEFAAIATRFFDETGATYEPGTFTDVTGSEWFAGAIMDAVNLGLIGGYEDGTVRPNNNITRAEACAIVNRTLGRVPDADHLLPENEMKTWPDNPESAWFYADMQEATNGHEYEWITEDGNKVENWTDLLDKEWSDR